MRLPGPSIETVRKASECEEEASRAHQEKLYGITGGLLQLAASHYRAADLLGGKLASPRADDAIVRAKLALSGVGPARPGVLGWIRILGPDLAIIAAGLAIYFLWGIR